MITSTIANEFQARGQAYDLDRIDRGQEGARQTLLRFQLHVDASYSHQSSLKVSTFAPAQGWVEVARLFRDTAQEAPSAQASGPDADARRRRYCAGLCEELREIAHAIVA